MIGDIIYRLRREHLKIRMNHIIESENIKDYASFTCNLQKLSDVEIRSIQDLWGRMRPRVKGLFSPVQEKYLTGHRLFKTLEYFDPKWLVMPVLQPRITLAMEDPIFESGLVHKAGYSMYLSEIKQPRNIVKCIDGQYFDEKMRPVNKEDAIKLLRNSGEAIVKTPYRSCKGRSIIKITQNDDLSRILDEYHGNLVCQDIIRQSADLSRLHPESVNSLRIISLFINGELSICVVDIRIGQGDSITDNAGAGGMMVGIHRDGTLHDYGYDHSGNRHYDNGAGITFKGYRINNLDKVLEKIKIYHPYYFPTMGLVAWDWSIDETGEPVLIEVNLGDHAMYPGITTTQLAKGAPLFGDRTEEVIDFVNAHEDRIWQRLNMI